MSQGGECWPPQWRQMGKSIQERARQRHLQGGAHMSPHHNWRLCCRSCQSSHPQQALQLTHFLAAGLLEPAGTQGPEGVLTTAERLQHTQQQEHAHTHTQLVWASSRPPGSGHLGGAQLHAGATHNPAATKAKGCNPSKTSEFQNLPTCSIDLSPLKCTMSRNSIWQ